MKNNKEKILSICARAQEAIQHEKRLLIAVPNLQAAQYIDTLLWNIPAENFIPHMIADAPTKEWIAITLQDRQNINHAERLFNLCSPPSILYQHVNEIYDLYDESDPQKTELSKQRMNLYESKGFSIHFVACI